MTRIASQNIVDLLPIHKGVIFVKKEITKDERIKASFFAYDTQTQSLSSATKNAYLITKFGSAASVITPHLADYISCGVLKLKNGSIFICYKSGEIGIFSDKGILLFSDDVYYHEYPVRDCTDDEDSIWFTVPDSNQIVCYSLDKKRITLRIGDDTNPTFGRPLTIEKIDKHLYVCCKSESAIKRVSLDNYTVETYKTFDEPLYKYLRIDDNEFVLLESGLYLL